MSNNFTRSRRRNLLPFNGKKAKNTFKFSVESSPYSNNFVTISKVTQDIPTWGFQMMEETRDEIHPGPPFTSGGPFQNIKIDAISPSLAQAVGEYITTGAGYTYTPQGTGRFKYSGGFLPPDDWPTEQAWTSGDLSRLFVHTNNPFIPDIGHLDQMAWDKTKPRIEQGGLFVAAAELKDIPKMFKTTAKLYREAWEVSHALFAPKNAASKRQLFMAPKRAADHFINHNFGWVPFVKDLSDFLSNLRDFREKIARLSKENGQWVRRSSILVNKLSDELIPGWSGTGIHNIWPLNTSPSSDTFSGTPTWEYRLVTQEVATAVGSFRYYIPYFDVGSPEWGGLGSVRRQLALHGARVSPSNIYKAVPWTWLVDWLTPVGHDLQVLQDEVMDNLVAKYLYLKHHLVRQIVFKQFVPFNAASGGPRTLVWTLTLSVKQRKEADSPFGFGLTWDNLSPKQLAILAALGILRT